MALGININSITGMFKNLLPLASLPEDSMHAMLFDNMTIDQVTRKEADRIINQYESSMPDFVPGRGMGVTGLADTLISDDPNALDKAIYQTENPNAMMTPWGPGLTSEAIEAMLAENPGAESLIGLEDDDRDGLRAEAEDILSKAGDFLGNLWEDAEAAAMSVGGNAIDVGKEIATSALDAFETGQDGTGQGGSFPLMLGALQPGQSPGKDTDEGMAFTPGATEGEFLQRLSGNGQPSGEEQLGIEAILGRGGDAGTDFTQGDLVDSQMPPWWSEHQAWMAANQGMPNEQPSVLPTAMAEPAPEPVVYEQPYGPIPGPVPTPPNWLQDGAGASQYLPSFGYEEAAAREDRDEQADYSDDQVTREEEEPFVETDPIWETILGMLNELLVPESDAPFAITGTDVGRYGATDDEIVGGIRRLLELDEEGQSAIDLDHVKRWITESGWLGWSREGTRHDRYPLAKRLEQLANEEAQYGPEQSGSGPGGGAGAGAGAGATTAIQAAGLGDTYSGQRAADRSLKQIFLDETGEMPDANLYAETEAMFRLYETLNRPTMRFDSGDVQGRYKRFLKLYLEDPSSYKRGPRFDEHIQELQKHLSAADPAWDPNELKYYFGAEGQADAVKRRNILIKIYQTGQSFAEENTARGNYFRDLDKSLEQEHLRGDPTDPAFVTNLFKIFTPPRDRGAVSGGYGSQIEQLPYEPVRGMSQTGATGATSWPGGGQDALGQFPGVARTGSMATYGPEYWGEGTPSVTPGETVGDLMARYYPEIEYPAAAGWPVATGSMVTYGPEFIGTDPLMAQDEMDRILEATLEI